jgi:tripartite-type tricarboxylate transporter receptor subunit TctC
MNKMNRIRTRSNHLVHRVHPVCFSIFARALTVIVVLGIELAAGRAGDAADYPTKPVRLIVPLTAGGPTDILARIVAAPLGTALGHQVIVDNRPGAGGNIGADLVAKSPPDGYTLFMGTSGPLSINSTLYPKLPYDPIRDFAPVILAASAPFVIIVHPSVKATTVKELIALAKAKPGQLNYASAGIGSFTHLSAELFRTLAGIDVVHVPFNGGGPTMVAMVSGQTQFMFGALLQMMPYLQGGKLRALGVGSAQRIAALPDVPTIAEAGVPRYEANSWWGIAGPAATPPAIIKLLNAETSAILAAPDIRKWFTSQGAEAAAMSPPEFQKWVAAEIAKWSRVVKDAGLRAE